MERQEMEQIVEQVTRQVLATLGQSRDRDAHTEGLPKVLVVGGTCREVPGEYRQNAAVLDVEDYRTNRNILRYDRVLIARLTITQLADIAQGRIGDEVSCAVVHALLNGVETLLLEDALPFRKFSGKGSTALYQLLESYVQTLQVFGVKPAARKAPPPEPEARPPKYAAPPVQVPRGSAVPNAALLITEAEALVLVKQGKTVSVPAGAIITPAAKDVFAQARVELIRES